MLKLFNTLTRKKEIFKPLVKGHVGLYSCGPTVYDFAHIGNLRAYIFVDMLKAYLEYLGYKVKHVMNITDVDDKTIRGSQKEGIPLSEFTKRFKEAFFEDLETLRIKPATIYPEATKHIPQMVALIKKLINKGYAYKAKDGSVYFNISRFKDYGKLSKLRIKDLKAGARVKQDEYKKTSASDFALWKAWSKTDGDVFWQTDIGKGRPGWHIECSTMSMHYLGETFDIHTGGVDLIFPHHENEIAQSEAATGKKFVRYWIHNEWLLVEGKKMSKSLGNFYTLRDLLNKGYDPIAFRYVILSSHYRSQLNFTFPSLKKAKQTINRLNDFVKRVNEIIEKKKRISYNKRIHSILMEARKKFEQSMNNDLNTPLALSVIFNMIRDINKEIDNQSADEKSLREVRDFLLCIDKIFRLIKPLKKKKLTRVEQKLIDEREKARKIKDYKKADEIRVLLKKKGILLEDTPEGVRWKKIK